MALAALIALPLTLALGQPRGNQNADTIEQLKRLDRAWLAAEKNHDVAYCERFFADDYVLVVASGRTYTKTQWLSALQSPGRAHYDVLRNDAIQVHLFGNVAILIDRTTVKGRDSRGRFFGGQYRVFRVMVRQNGRWRAAGAVMNTIRPN